MKDVEILSEKIDYESPHMDIMKYQVKWPDKKTRPYWVLDRKSNFSIIIPILKDNKTVLVGQYRFPIRKYTWEFSMGTVEGKSPLEIAKQELLEGTGITGSKWDKVGEFYLAPGISSQVGHVYIARNLKRGTPMPEEDEDIKIKEVSLEEVDRMILKQEIKDGPTILAWQFYKNHII